MAEPGPQEPRGNSVDDPTRDIRLPLAPGSPPLVVRPEWSSYTARQQPVPADPPSRESTAPPPIGAGGSAARRSMDLLADEQTDQLVSPGGPQRERTLQFAPGDAASARPPAAPAVAERGRSPRWPWVLMALLPVIVIVGSGIWLFILLSHA